MVKIWNMDDTTEPISKFGNSCTSHGLIDLGLTLTPDLHIVGFLNQKTMTPMTSMAFHPHHMVLGCSTGDGHINLFEMGESDVSSLLGPPTDVSSFAEDYKNALDKVAESLSPLGMAVRSGAWS